MASFAGRALRSAQEFAQDRDVLVMRYSESNYLMPHIRRTLEVLGIEVALDIGANTGQTVRELRGLGFEGQIVSFEPTPHLFAGLQADFGGDRRWHGHQWALGSEPGELVLHRYREESMNSFLLPSDVGAERFRTLRADPIGEERVEVQRLDDIWDEVVPSGRVFMKVDTQGFDLEVLKGAESSLERVDAILTEVPFNQIYEGMHSARTIFEFMDDHGFELTGLYPVKRTLDKARLIEADCMFVRSSRFE